MKTVIIWDQVTEAPISFFVVDGDYRHLNGAYINSGRVEISESEEELFKVLYDGEDYKCRYVKLDEFPTQAVKNGAHVIVAGWAP